MQRFKEFLGDLETLSGKSPSSDNAAKDYVHPKLKNLGSVSIVLIREAIAPVVFKNFEQEITDIEIRQAATGNEEDSLPEVYVRAVPNKFKYPERGRGLQILRAFQTGGRFPQNRTVLPAGDKPSQVFDLNTLVFGDSVQKPDVLPIKAAVNYSDALSVLPKPRCVESTDHINAMEDGSLWNSEKKQASVNIFTRHFIKPGTLMVQVLSTRGRLLPQIGLDHLLLCIGVAGTYGGQTSVTGTNIRSHFVGIYGDLFEKPETSPYEIVKWLHQADDLVKTEVTALTKHLHDHLSKVHKVSMNPEDATAYLQQLLNEFEQDHQTMKQRYVEAYQKIGEFFDGWFGKGTGGEKKKTGGSKSKGKKKGKADTDAGEMFDQDEQE